MRHLDIDLLRTLVVVADSGSFSAAGQQLGRTQSAISLQIKRLEETLGHLLLDRAQGRLAGPTEEGRVLLDYARRILTLNDEACDCFLRPALRGRLRVGVPEELMGGPLPGVLAAFSHSYPAVEVSLRCDLSVAQRGALEAGELDVAIVKCLAGHAGADRVLRREALCWLGADNPAGGRLALARQTPLPLALFHEGCMIRVAALAALARAGQGVRIVFSGNAPEGIRQAVLAGLAIAPLPASLAGGGLVPLREGLPALPMIELVARFAPGEPSAAATRLVDLLAAALWQPDQALAAA